MNITKILELIRPNEQWVMHGNDYESLSWLDSTPKPTLDELAAGDAKLNDLAYREKRAAEYPAIGDQLDAMWKGGDVAAAMLAQVQAVKAKYPKPQ